jgi:hypothetical protein
MVRGYSYYDRGSSKVREIRKIGDQFIKNRHWEQDFRESAVESCMNDFRFSDAPRCIETLLLGDRSALTA